MQDYQVECLQNVPVENITQSAMHNGPTGYHQAVVDGDFSPFPFLPKHPVDLLTDGGYNSDIKIMIGCNR